MRHSALSLAVFTTLGLGTAIAQADAPGLYFDMRVHGTGAKDATVNGPGDTFTLDLFVTAVGANGNTTDDSITNVFSNFFSSNGGLQGDLIGLNPPAPFNQISASPGEQHDLDGDGDLDVGGGSVLVTQFNTFYFSRGSTGQITPPGGLLIAQIRFTAVQLSAATTQIGWSTFDSPAGPGDKAILGHIDGEILAGDWRDPLVHFSPLTIHAASVFDPGTPTYITGTQSSHLDVTGTIRQGAGAAVVVDSGITLHAGSLFDMRDSSGHLNNQEVRINDLASGNEGGAIFVQKMTIGNSSLGKYSHSGGFTSIAGNLVLGNAVGADGSLSVSGGTMRSGATQVGAAGNASISVSGGFLTVSSLDMRAPAGVNALVDVSDGVLTLTSGTLGGAAGNATLRVRDNGHVAVNGTLYVGTETSSHPGVLEISGGSLSAANLRVNQAAAVQQTGGTVAPSFFAVSAPTGAASSYTLNDGTFNAGGMFVGDHLDRPGLFVQNGGQLRNTGTMYVVDQYQMNDGAVNSATINISAPTTVTAGLFQQAGGSVVMDSLVVAGTYRITGGNFTVNQSVDIIGDGTIDFANSPAAFRAGPDSLIALPASAIGNTANASLHGEIGSLLNYPAGYNPAAHFKTVSTDGILHEDGTALLIPHGKSITGSGAIFGATTNHGGINPGYGIGEIDITGDYTQAGDGALNAELGPESAGDLLNVSGLASLAGALNISLQNGFVPTDEDVYTILAAGAITGKFANATSQVNFAGGMFDVTYDGGAVTLSNFVSTPEPGTMMLSAVAAAALLARRRRTNPTL